MLAFISVAMSVACSSVAPDIETIPWVEEAHSVAGEWCMVLKVRVPDTAGLLELVDRLRQIPGVEKTETIIVLKTQVERPVIEGSGREKSGFQGFSTLFVKAPFSTAPGPVRCYSGEGKPK